MSSTDEKEQRDSSGLEYVEARPFVVDIKDENDAIAEGDEDEDDSLLSQSANKPTGGLSRKFWIAAATNVLATVAIVFVNKRIFSNPSLAHCQVAFAAFHFLLTFLVLFAASRPPFSLFEPKPLNTLTILPLACAMIVNVVTMNLSLANSSVQFYQIVRVLVTPVVAALNFALYRHRLPLAAALTLIPICAGVAVVSYCDAGRKSATRETTPLGVVCAFVALGASGLYTVWIARYHAALKCGSLQLLLNQSPVSVLVMLFVIPFTDDVSAFGSTGRMDWGLILLSGGLACLINLSQFAIIAEAGPVESTVVGHLKTVLIVAIGWVASRRQVNDMGSLVGIMLAVGGIFSYSYVTQREARK